jgi:hypothetical protein
MSVDRYPFDEPTETFGLGAERPAASHSQTERHPRRQLGKPPTCPPIFAALQEADLITEEEISEALLEWHCVGGQLTAVLVNGLGFSIPTLRFFATHGQTAYDSGCTRIGEFLQAADLVSEEEIQHTLRRLQAQGRYLRLGQALARQGLIKESTAHYFAKHFSADAVTTSTIDDLTRYFSSDSLLERSVQPTRQPAMGKPLDRNNLGVSSGDVTRPGNAQRRYTEFALIVDEPHNPCCYLLNKTTCTVGRDRENDLQIANPYLSRRHATLIRIPSQVVSGGFTYLLVDGDREGNPSRNGVTVNANKVATHRLAYGDKIVFGGEVKAYFYPVAELEKQISIGVTAPI